MAVVTLPASGQTYTAPTETAVFEDILSGLRAPFLSSNQGLDADGARWAAISYGLAGIIAGGVVARQRAAKGEDPFLKVFF